MPDYEYELRLTRRGRLNGAESTTDALTIALNHETSVPIQRWEWDETTVTQVRSEVDLRASALRLLKALQESDDPSLREEMKGVVVELNRIRDAREATE